RDRPRFLRTDRDRREDGRYGAQFLVPLHAAVQPVGQPGGHPAVRPGRRRAADRTPAGRAASRRCAAVARGGALRDRAPMGRRPAEVAGRLRPGMPAAPRRTRRRPRRWWLFRPLDLAARLWPVWRRPRGVLMIRMDGIGDMVLFQGAFRHYTEALGVPRSEITVLGGRSWASLAETVYQGCRFRAIDERAYERHPFYRFRISLWVRRKGFAVAICDSYWRKAMVADSLVYASAAPRRIVAKPLTSPKTQALFDWHLARVHQTINTGPYPTHETVRHFRFVSAVAGREFPAATPSLPWRRAPRPLTARYAVLNLGSN